jgi:hypothetical protein
MRRWSLLALVASLFLAAPSFAAAPGFLQDFAADAGDFMGGSTVTRPLTDGVGGSSDPYIQIANTLVSQLGAFTTGANFTGDLTADGVTGFSFYLRDTGANDDHEIHVGVGQALVNFWQSVQGFNPPDGSWQKFSVDITDQSQWVQIIGTGTFADALAASNRLLFRHDLPPFVQAPNSASGEFAVDRVRVLPVAPSVPAASATGRAVLMLLLVTLAGVALCGRRVRRGHLAG